MKGRAAVGVRNKHWQWVTMMLDSGATNLTAHHDVTLVSRLVPAPRVITDPDELDKRPDGALPLDECMQALRKIDGGWAPADVGSLPKS